MLPAMTDLRDLTRALRRRPAFTVMTILVLALGIGANTAMFSLFDAVILRALPFREPDRLVWAWHRWAGGDTGVFAIPDLWSIARETDRSKASRRSPGGAPTSPIAAMPSG